jgi:signal transduction histidine kinase
VNLHENDTIPLSVAHVVRMPSMSSGATHACQWLSLSSVVRTALPLMRAAISDTAVLRIATDEHAPLVQIDPTAMQHVLLKLVRNASQAIRQPHGVIEIGVAGMIGSDQRNRPFVRLTVADNGIGMDGATVGLLRQQLAEPASAHGAGPGLRSVHRAVYAHGGRLQIDSQPGGGTMVRIDLPAYSRHSEVRDGEDGDRSSVERGPV